MDVPFAQVGLAAKAGQYVMYVLAVAGGFLVGNLVTLLLCRLIAGMMFKKRLPVQLERALRVLGGLAVAALVAFLLFRFGPGWGFGGSGSGEGDGTGAPTKGGEQPDAAKDKTPPKKADPKKQDPAELASGVRVTILRPDAFPRTFLFEGSPEGVDLAAAKDRLRQLHEGANGRLKFVDLLIYKNSTAGDNPVVRDFEEYAHDLGLRSARKKLDQTLPE